MQSWRALGRRALGWRSGRNDGGSHPVMTGDARVPGAADRASACRAQDSRAAGAEEDRIARGEGVQDQIDRGADVREQNRLTAPGAGRPGTPERAQVMPERGAGSPESSRVPGWLQDRGRVVLAAAHSRRRHLPGGARARHPVHRGGAVRRGAAAHRPAAAADGEAAPGRAAHARRDLGYPADRRGRVRRPGRADRCPGQRGLSEPGRRDGSTPSPRSSRCWPGRPSTSGTTASSGS